VGARVRSAAPQGLSAAKTRILLLGPSRAAVSGVSTHINQLFESELSSQFHFEHFQVGSEGRNEGRVGVLLRVITSPFALAGCIIRFRPLIVHINTSFEPKGYWRDLIYLIVARALGRKVVYQIHGGALPGEFFATSRILSALLRRVLSWADAVVLIVDSQIGAYRKFAPRAHVVCIANAVALYDTNLSSDRYTADRTLRIAYIGRLTANKGILETIEAVGILCARGVNVGLTIAGSGDARDVISRAIAAANLGERVRLLAALFGTAKQQLWEASHVFAFPTLREGLPYSLLESMAAGAVPVVVPVGEIPDVMQDEVHGLFVPPSDPQALAVALERLARDRDLLYRLALAARDRIASEYSVARLAKQFKELYERVASRPLCSETRIG
jgi:glycosyltransferase involved in cell wall biosynthesis